MTEPRSTRERELEMARKWATLIRQCPDLDLATEVMDQFMREVRSVVQELCEPITVLVVAPAPEKPDDPDRRPDPIVRRRGRN